jgi:hypothetical protein
MWLHKVSGGSHVSRLGVLDKPRRAQVPAFDPQVTQVGFRFDARQRLRLDGHNRIDESRVSVLGGCVVEGYRARNAVMSSFSASRMSTKMLAP